MHDDERALIAHTAARETARVVEFYEVGALKPHYKVRKAGKKQAASIIADMLDAKARRAWLAALQAMRGHFDEAAFTRAYAKGDVGGMMAAFEVSKDDIAATLKPALDVVRSGFAQAAFKAAGMLGADYGLHYTFDITNADAVQWGYVWSSELITNITQQQKDAVKLAIGQAMNADLSRRDATLLIRNIVGLNDRQAAAVGNMRADLLTTGAANATIESKTARYASQLLNERAHLIARTEIMSAANAGQREAWDQAADKGLIDRQKTSRQWILTDDDRLCDECEDYDGEEVDFDDEFEDGDPPLHPGCRCTVGLTFDS